MRRHIKRLDTPIQLVAAIVLLAMLVVTPMQALAAGETALYLSDFSNTNPNGTPKNRPNAYGGSNNMDPGHAWGILHGISNDGHNYTARGEEIWFSPSAVSWIQNNTQPHGYVNQYQPSIVFHAQDVNPDRSTDCSSGGWASPWSDLPGVYYTVKDACGFGDESEIRMTVGLPWELRSYDYEGYEFRYTTSVDWQDYLGYYVNQITIDNYWLDTRAPWWGSDVIIRDRMTKFCFEANRVWNPYTGSTGIYSCRG